MINMLYDIEGYDGDYKVDKLGNVWSFKMKQPKILATWTGTTSPYKQVQLSKNNEVKKYLVHRLVAETLIPNPNNLPQVNHIDGNCLNNSVDNLEWVSPSENMHKAYMTSNLGPVRNYRSVELFLKGQSLGVFKSTKAACREAAKLGASFSGLEKYKTTGDFEIKNV